MKRIMVAPTLLCLAALLPAIGCIESEQRHVLTLELDGSLTWVAWEEGARSNADTLSGRRAEEAAFIDSARNDSTDVAKGIADLGPIELTTHVLRDRVPFAVMTEARFGSPDDVLQRLLDATRGSGDVRLERDVVGGRLTIEARQVDEGAPSEESPAAVLLRGDMVFVLPEGAFTEAVGFELTKPGVAVLQLEGEQAPKEVDGTMTWSLAWTADR